MYKLLIYSLWPIEAHKGHSNIFFKFYSFWWNWEKKHKNLSKTVRKLFDDQFSWERSHSPFRHIKYNQIMKKAFLSVSSNSPIIFVWGLMCLGYVCPGFDVSGLWMAPCWPLSLRHWARIPRLSKYLQAICSQWSKRFRKLW